MTYRKIISDIGIEDHAREIYIKAHANALDQYRDPSKRRDGKEQSQEEVAHKTAWAAVNRVYKKEGDKWVKK